MFYFSEPELNWSELLHAEPEPLPEPVFFLVRHRGQSTLRFWSIFLRAVNILTL